MVSKSQIKAKNNYEKSNPLKATYWNRKSNAKSFIRPKAGTKLENAINDNMDIYIKDLQEMNYETIINLCDLLGMSDIYLGGD